MPAAAARRSRRSRRETPPLPLDLVLEIAARSDPATLVRCAATCKDLRRQVADPGFHGSLRLRHADRFVPSLLLGHLVSKSPTDLHIVENATLRATKLLSAEGWGCQQPGQIINGKPPPLSWSHKVLTARDGLLLISTRDKLHTELMLRVCNPASGRCQIVPRQRYEGQYVLLVSDNNNNINGNDGAIVGRRFRVLKVTSKSVMNSKDRRILQFQTFFSEHGRWAGRSVNVPIPFVHGGWFRQQPLVTNDGALHWLCRSDKLYYIVKLHVESAQVTSSELPVRFHREYGGFAAAKKQILLATTSAGSGTLCVFVAEKEKITVWAQSKRDSSRWTKQPQMEVEYDATMCCETEGRMPRERPWTVKLEWFSDRSGAMLMEAPGHGFCMLDVRSKKVFGWPPLLGYCWGADVNCPYDMDISSWVPTFTKKF
ncbi:hypothetical protein QOZ80_5BG0433190 [Eleusine coracana subsp. coracana]|nr:hypothetical protein QOZ80_5BG0433190 [Eleusine coracana subsp. coracana]